MQAMAFLEIRRTPTQSLGGVFQWPRKWNWFSIAMVVPNLRKWRLFTTILIGVSFKSPNQIDLKKFIQNLIAIFRFDRTLFC